VPVDDSGRCPPGWFGLIEEAPLRASYARLRVGFGNGAGPHRRDTCARCRSGPLPPADVVPGGDWSAPRRSVRRSAGRCSDPSWVQRPMGSFRVAQKLRRERLRLRTFTSADAPGGGYCERCLPPDASRNCTATTTKAVVRFRSSRPFAGRTSRSRRHRPSPSRLKMLVAGCQGPFV
jgi:hypothetical protein